MAKIIDFNLVECDEILFESTSLQSYGYGIVSQLPMKDREMSIQAKGVYSYLVSCAGNDKQTYPTKEKMCYDLGIKKVDTLTKYIKQIQARGYIKIVKTKKGNLHYRNVYLIATDTRSIEIWKREFEEGKEIEEAEIITENKKSLTYGEVKDNKKSNNSTNNSIPKNDDNIQQFKEKNIDKELGNEKTEQVEDIRDIAYARCLIEYEGFENFDNMRKDFFVNMMINKICKEGN
jgi:hypothetical protein